MLEDVIIGLLTTAQKADSAERWISSRRPSSTVLAGPESLSRWCEAAKELCAISAECLRLARLSGENYLYAL